MGVRYVWGKYTPKEKYYSNSITVNGADVPGTAGTSNYNILALKDRSPSLDSTSGKFSYSGAYRSAGRGVLATDDIDANTYNYAAVGLATSYPATGSSDKTGSITGLDSYLQRRYTNVKWRYRYDANASNPEKMNVITCVNSSGDKYSFYFYFPVLGNFPDEFIEYVSSSSSSSYPNFDKDDDGYFYSTETNDVIDPSSVTIPDVIIGGNDVTITVSPSESASGNKYGTISYTYSYKFNDTDWTDLVTTSELSHTLRVPKGKTSVQVRVRAKDDIGFTSETYVMSKETTVYASNPPSAPGSISVDRVVAGWTTTVSVTPAKDDDGSVVYYAFERSVDSGEWEEVQKSDSLTFSEKIISSWKTVTYRAKAIDDSGIPGSYVTSETYDVVTDSIVIIGPRNIDFGNKIGSFNLSFYVLIAGDSSDKQVSVTVVVDAEQTYSQVVNSEELITVRIDTSDLSKDRHAIEITATKEGYEMAQTVYNFMLLNITLPEGTNVVQFQDSTGKGIIPVAAAQSTLMSDGTDVETKIKELESKMSALS